MHHRPSNILIKSIVSDVAPASTRRLNIPAPIRSVIQAGIAKISDFGLSALLPAGPRGPGSLPLMVNVGESSLTFPELLRGHLSGLLVDFCILAS